MSAKKGDDIMADITAQQMTNSAKNQMRFQERMSNTAHQREVKDLQAAGLNPVLSAGGNGASTPVGAAGDYSDPTGNALNEAVSALSNVAITNGKVLDTLTKDSSTLLGTFFDDFSKSGLDSFVNYFKTGKGSLEDLLPSSSDKLKGTYIGLDQYGNLRFYDSNNKTAMSRNTEIMSGYDAMRFIDSIIDGIHKGDAVPVTTEVAPVSNNNDNSRTRTKYEDRMTLPKFLQKIKQAQVKANAKRLANPWRTEYVINGKKYKVTQNSDIDYTDDRGRGRTSYLRQSYKR